jgi:hypothetical protein
LRHRRPAAILITGTALLALGVAVTLTGVYLRLIPLLVLGTMIAGFGWGAGFFGGIRSVMPLAAADERAGLLAALYTQSYIAFAVPAIVAGVFTPRLGLPLTSYVYGGGVIVLAATSLVAMLMAARKPRLCPA